MSEFRRVAVLGSGVMGAGIATHLANAGIASLLYDIVPPDTPSDAPPAVRSKLATDALKAATKAKPPPLFRPGGTELVRPCNYDDDAGLLASCDWVVEVVVERLDIKRKVFAWVAEHCSKDAIISSNTSGIPLSDMAAEMSEDMRRRFCITHFFNPVRFMRLLEIVAGPETDPAVIERMARFGDVVLGKGIVYAKDTPNFIANRIGTYGMASVFRHMQEANLPIEAVDAIFGSQLGRPSSAVFRTADVVGLDTLSHVMDNLYEALPDDEERAILAAPDLVKRLVAAGKTGAKAGAGFYKKVKVDGKSEILAIRRRSACATSTATARSMPPAAMATTAAPIAMTRMSRSGQGSPSSAMAWTTIAMVRPTR